MYFYYKPFGRLLNMFIKFIKVRSKEKFYILLVYRFFKKKVFHFILS